MPISHPDSASYVKARLATSRPHEFLNERRSCEGSWTKDFFESLRIGTLRTEVSVLHGF